MWRPFGRASFSTSTGQSPGMRRFLYVLVAASRPFSQPFSLAMIESDFGTAFILLQETLHRGINFSNESFDKPAARRYCFSSQLTQIGDLNANCSETCVEHRRCGCFCWVAVRNLHGLREHDNPREHW